MSTRVRKTSGWFKSSFCNSDGCLEVDFKKSSHCNADGCIECAQRDDAVIVRDSKLGEESPTISISNDDWAGFIDAIQTPFVDDTVDTIIRSIGVGSEHTALMRISADEWQLRHWNIETEKVHMLNGFTESEVSAFVKGVVAGEFDLV